MGVIRLRIVLGGSADPQGVDWMRVDTLQSFRYLLPEHFLLALGGALVA